MLQKGEGVQKAGDMFVAPAIPRYRFIRVEDIVGAHGRVPYTKTSLKKHCLHNWSLIFGEQFTAAKG